MCCLSAWVGRYLQEKLQSLLVKKDLLGFYTFCVLHSLISTQQQKEVCKKTSPQYGRIILATNIAESSVTICDLELVVDFGIEQSARVEEGGLVVFDKCWCSQASSKQWAGRVVGLNVGQLFACFPKKFSKQNSQFANHLFSLILLLPSCCSSVGSWPLAVALVCPLKF